MTRTEKALALSLLALAFSKRPRVVVYTRQVGAPPPPVASRSYSSYTMRTRDYNPMDDLYEDTPI